LVWAHGAGDGSLALLAIMLGCAPDLEPELGEFVARGEHVEVWASEGLEVCGGNVEHMDRFVKRFREVVGPRPEAEALHRYYVLDEEDWADWADVGGCPENVAGCAVQRRTIYARVAPSTHELVHAEIAADGYSLFEEGIAEVFGDGPPDAWPLSYEIVGLLQLRDAKLPSGAYERAAHFARFLIERHGIDGFLRLRDATVRDDTFDELEWAFETTLGSSIERELAAYQGYTAWCQNAGYRLALLECETPPTPWTDERSFVERVDLTCANEDVLGPFHGEIFAFRAFEVVQLEEYDIELEATDTAKARAWIVKCGSRCRGWAGDGVEYPLEPPQIVIEAHAGERREAILYPGRYWVRMSRPADEPGEVTLHIEGHG
jgi:hypothetical protein